MSNSPVGQRVMILRGKHNLNQKEFGQLVNVSHAAISRLESGQTLPMDLIYKISHHFNVSVNWLLYGNETNENTSEIDAALGKKHYPEQQDPGANQVSWKERTMAEMQKRIESLEADKVYLAECLKLALNQNANFPEGNELSLAPENEGCKQIVFMPNYYSAVVTQRVA